MPNRLFAAVLLASSLFSAHAAPVAAGPAPTYGYTVVAKYPHSTNDFTEGLIYLDGKFYEGTGMEGRSGVKVYEPATGKVLQEHKMTGAYFGEGIVDVGPYLYQWTWQTHIGVVMDRATLKPVRTFDYTGEGWAMTKDNTSIITSDGTSTLRFRDPKTFKETRHIEVHDGSKPIDQLNELEYIKGEIWSNVWHDNRIARIDPKDGHVIAWVDFTGLLPANQKKDDESVLNGIAYDAQKDRIFVTGKQWPTIFEIKVGPKK
jgi:glutaminyl-peptide cyclotransferase